MSTTDCASPERDAVLAEEQHRSCRRARACMSVTSEKRPSATVTRSPRRSRRAAPGVTTSSPRPSSTHVPSSASPSSTKAPLSSTEPVASADASSGRTPSFLTSTCAACAGPERDLAGLGGRRVRRTRPGGIRPLEEPEAELQAQHAAHRVVDERELDLAGLDELLEVREVGAAAHVEVDAGPDRQGRGLAQVGGDARR